ncbi:bacteriocin secretion protein, putative [Babesia ovis]|uniref:Bacteriocin secretion protein, putative n=1 Tax=Babesia ovis TaxID=5869 RepID=A0A9W5WWB5_BABOV|nr:bacteriocin secretion protein, putative [Babesia ovis]
MVSFATLWSTSLDLWVKQVLKDLRRHRIRALLGLLTTLSRRRGLEAFFIAIIHSRGDCNDPVITLLLRLCELSRYKGDHHESKNAETETSKNASKDRGMDDVRMPASCMLSRCILASLTPMLLHVFLSRRKVSIKSQGIWHCYSAIIHDVTGFLKSTSDFAESKIIRCWKSASRLRSIRVYRPCNSTVGITTSDSLERAILGSKSIAPLLRQVDLSESASQNNIVERIKYSAVGNAHPVDNISGLQTVLVSISELYTARASGDIPCSLYQVYEHMQNGQGTINSYVEDAIVYLQRIKRLDLEFRNSRVQMLREAAKDYYSLKQTLGHHTDGPVREAGVWENVKRVFRINSIPLRPPNTGFYTRLLGSTLDKHSTRQLMDDRQVSHIVGHSLLFCSEHVGIFAKLHSAVKHAGGELPSPSHSRLLLLAAKAILLNFPENELSVTRHVKLESPLMVYYSFLRLIDAMSSDVFSSVAQQPLRPSTQMAVAWIADGISEYSNKYSRDNTVYKHSGSFSGTNGDTSSDIRYRTESVQEPTCETSHIAEGDGDPSSDGSAPVSMLSKRRTIVESLSNIGGRRMYLTEEALLCILRAHATVFKVNFDHLREAFRNIREYFTLLLEQSKAYTPAEEGHVPYVDMVGEVFDGTRMLHNDVKGSLNRLIVPYSLFEYAQMVFSRLSEYGSKAMYPQAFWLANCHMSMLGKRIRGRVGELHL